jgi:predicted enzyme related to lactoylglutathione lyase
MGNPVVHFEIGCRDLAKSGDFYRKLFGWTMQAYGPAQMIDTGASEGIRGHMTALGHEPHNYCLVYVQVDNLPDYVAKATQLGGALLIPPTEVPGMGHFAWLKDPEGTVVGLWKPAAK